MVVCPIYDTLWLGRDACVRSGLERREPRNGENWRCPSKRWWRGIFEKLQATADPGALTRSGKNHPGAKSHPFLGISKVKFFYHRINTLYTDVIYFKCKQEAASLVETPLASCQVV